jgi:hypothetical protein
MKLNCSDQTLPTMKPKILQAHDDIIASLKAFYVENHVTNFADSRELYFSFRTAFAKTGFHIHAEMEPPAPRLQLLTIVLDELLPSKADCLQAANLFNNHCRFVSVTVLDEAERFALNSILIVGDDGCLRSQIEPFATAHMAGVAQVGSLLGRFARQEINLEQLELELALLAQESRSTQAEEEPAHPTSAKSGRCHFEQN